jgi:pentatricopeptide repeat protein
MGLYQKLYSVVKVTEDSHLKPAEEKEVLPWFYVETAFNPHDIRGYVMGAYWLYRSGREKESLKFLHEADEKNPNSARILGAVGELYFKRGRNDEAVSYLERACRLWKEARGINAVSNKYEESDRLFAFDLLANIYLKDGDREKALQLYKELLKFGTNNAVLKNIEKIEDLT